MTSVNGSVDAVLDLPIGIIDVNPTRPGAAVVAIATTAGQKSTGRRRTPDAYRAALTAIVRGAGNRTALLSPPVLGEDLDSGANRLAAEFAAIARAVAADEGVTYLPLFERTATVLRDTGAPPSWPTSSRASYGTIDRPCAGLADRVLDRHNDVMTATIGGSVPPSRTPPPHFDRLGRLMSSANCLMP